MNILTRSPLALDASAVSSPQVVKRQSFLYQSREWMTSARRKDRDTPCDMRLPVHNMASVSRTQSSWGKNVAQLATGSLHSKDEQSPLSLLHVIWKERRIKVDHKAGANKVVLGSTRAYVKDIASVANNLERPKSMSSRYQFLDIRTTRRLVACCKLRYSQYINNNLKALMNSTFVIG